MTIPTRQTPGGGTDPGAADSGSAVDRLARQLALLAASTEPAVPPSESAVPAPAPAPVVMGPRVAVSTGSGMAAGSTSETQRAHVADLVERYTHKTRSSKELTQRYRRVLADSRAAVGFRRSSKEMQYPLAARRASGSWLEDIDGNRYVDITMGFGILLFGHEPEFVTEAVREHLGRGIRLGPRSVETGEAAELLAGLTGLERVAFANSGTEANSAAIRLARAATGRSTIVSFQGAYHGHADNVLGRAVGGGSGHRTLPVSHGIPQGAVDDLIVLNFGDPASLDAIDALGDTVAAVIVEPVQSRNPGLRPVEFVRRLREITRRHGSVLFFDEMLTGFRPHPRGAQGHYGVQPDLATYGKAIGGGYPIGAIAGRADIMDGIDGGFWQYGDDSGPGADTTFFGGTYIQHPLAMTAAKAVLTHLKDHSPVLQDRLNARTDQLAARLNGFFEEEEFPLRMKHFGSMFKFEHQADMDLLYHHMVLKGLYVWEWRAFFLSTAHTDGDLDFIADTVTESLRELRQAGFFPRRTPPKAPAVARAARPVAQVERPAPEFSLSFFGDYPQDAPAASETPAASDAPAPKADPYGVLIDAARYADAHGFHAVWLPERHFHSFGGLFPNPAVLGAAVARETERIRINSGSVVLPLHDPIRVAEEWAMVDNLSGGRVGLGCASGWNSRDFVFYPDSFGRHKEVTRDHLAQIRALWRGEALQRRSGDGREVEVRLFPRPLQQEPPLSMAVVGRRESYEEAARSGLGILTNLMAQSVEQLADNVAHYRATRERHGLDPDAGRVTVLMHTYLGADLDTARAEALDPLARYMRSSLALSGQVANSLGLTIDVDATSEDDLDFVFRRAYQRYCDQRALIGTPDSCAEVVAAVRAAGVDEIAALVDFGVTPDQLRTGLTHLDALRRRHHPDPDADADAGPAVSPEPARVTLRSPAAPAAPDRLHEVIDAVHDAVHNVLPDPVDDVTSPTVTPSTTAPVTDVAAASLAPVERSGPATAAQRRLWLASQLAGGTAYNELQAVRLHGVLDRDAMRVAVQTVVDRHDGLRTVFRCDEDDETGETLRQVVKAPAPIGLPLTDARDQTPEEAVRAALRVENERLYDLANGPLFGARLVQLGADDHLLVIGMHHIVIDSHSADLITKDLQEVYRAELAGRAPAFEGPAGTSLTVPATVERPDDLAWWRGHLGSAPPVLRLPTDRPRTRVVQGRGAAVAVRFDSAATGRLQSWSSRNRVTLFATLFTGWQTVLRRFSGQDEFILATTFGQRDPQAQDIVGFFVSLLPLRCALTDDTALADAVRTCRNTLLDAGERADVRLDGLIAEINPEPGAPRPLVPVSIDFDNEALPGIDLPGLRAEPIASAGDSAPLELMLLVTKDPDGLNLKVKYDVELYDEATVRRLVEQLHLVLTAIAGGGVETVGDLPLVTGRDEAEVRAWETSAPAAAHPPVLTGIRPDDTDEVALVDADGREWTRSQVRRAADAVTARLMAAGVGRGDIVATALPKGAEFLAALIGIVTSGAAYLPLDLAQPLPRLSAMLADARPKALICEDSAHPVADEIPEVPRVRVDLTAGPTELAGLPTPVGTDLLYVLYTSGSTGRPKGVAVEHGNMAATLSWYLSEVPVTADDRLSWYSSPGFDFGHVEMWPALASGARLYAVPDEVRLDPDALTRWFVERGITVTNLPTPIGEGVLARSWPADAALRVLHTGGEQVVGRPRPGAPFTAFNVYGPTEATVFCTWGAIAPEGPGTPPIGRPVPGVRVRVLDAAGRLLPPGVTGELSVGGEQVARGYHGSDSLTAERFSTDEDGCRWYRTGDLVRWRGDGLLEFVGRSDDQVQIRGVRVEPAEVSRAVGALPGVAEALVLGSVDPATGQGRLTAWVRPDGPVADENAHVVRWRQQLAAALPRPMVPEQWTLTDRLPTDINGKRLRRPEPAAVAGPSKAPETDEIAERDTVAQTVRAEWSGVLGMDELPSDASFFDLGGHSLSVIKLLGRIERKLGVRLSLSEFFDAPTLDGTTAAVSARRAAAGSDRVRGQL
ncbi:MupA/Atu3671 family FMN-dependent luciferase-like monooxygenase [Streptomyces sp. NPDC091279]|uniref:MupA/Atu3671 family FMN-dependent luciferase-like monooxygenase n=1 Tax=Streptomyces sp. NPDC091279 TaxID=3365983 RepID=UPI0038090A5D